MCICQLLLIQYLSSRYLKVKLKPYVNLVVICGFREDEGYRLMSEQVSHHPPVSAFYAESLSQDFQFHGSIYPKLKFWGKSVEAEPKGTMTLELSK